MENETFTRDEVILWFAKRLEDPERVRAIEADLALGSQSRVASLLEEMRNKQRRHEERRTSGELGRLAAGRRATSVEGDLEIRPVAHVYYPRTTSTAFRLVEPDSSSPNLDRPSEAVSPRPAVETHLPGVGREYDSREVQTDSAILHLYPVKPISATRHPGGVSADEHTGHRETLSLIELMTIIAAAAVLIVIFIPALASSREAARRAQCTNNLKQIGLATATFESMNSHMPPGIGPFPWYSGGGARGTVAAQLLPYLEHSSAYAMFNFSINLNVVAQTEANYTAQTQLVSTLICPSDPSTARLLVDGAQLGYSNYFAGTGNTASLEIGSASYQESNLARLGVFNYSLDTRQPRYLDAPADTRPNPLFNRAIPVTLAQITDGTSNTAVFAETKRSQAVANTAAEIGVADLANVYTINGDFTGVDAERPPVECETFANQIRLRYRGQQYYRSLPSTGYYSHTMTPNAKKWDCSNNPRFNQGHTAARSYHPGGVNVGFCDGSVRFVKDSINDHVWRSLGTRAGGEVVRADDL